MPTRMAKEVFFEDADVLFSNVVAVDIRRDNLEGAVTVFNNDAEVLGTGFIIEDLEVNAVDFGLEVSHDDVVGGDAVAIVARLKCRDKDGIGVDVVGEHNVLVATSRADREPTYVISVELTDWIYPDMELLILEVWELTSDVKKRVNGDWIW